MLRDSELTLEDRPDFLPIQAKSSVEEEADEGTEVVLSSDREGAVEGLIDDFERCLEGVVDKACLLIDDDDELGAFERDERENSGEGQTRATVVSVNRRSKEVWEESKKI